MIKRVVVENNNIEVAEESSVVSEKGFASSDFGEHSALAYQDEQVFKVRLDKWLWAARFFKTRALARAAIESGSVFYEGSRTKPSREIEISAKITILQNRMTREIVVAGLSTRRRSAEEAVALFHEVRKNSIQDTNNAIAQQNKDQSFRKNRQVRFLRRSLTKQPERESR